MEVGRASQQVESAKKIKADFLTSLKTEQTIIDKEGKTQGEDY